MPKPHGCNTVPSSCVPSGQWLSAVCCLIEWTDMKVGETSCDFSDGIGTDSGFQKGEVALSEGMWGRWGPPSYKDTIGDVKFRELLSTKVCCICVHARNGSPSFLFLEVWWSKNEGECVCVWGGGALTHSSPPPPYTLDKPLQTTLNIRTSIKHRKCERKRIQCHLSWGRQVLC